MRGWSGEDINDDTEFLIPDSSLSYSPVDGVSVNAYGFINGKLHVQVHYDNILTYDNHGFIQVKDVGGLVVLRRQETENRLLSLFGL